MKFYQIIACSTKMFILFVLASCASVNKHQGSYTKEADIIFLSEKELIPSSLFLNLPGFLLTLNQFYHFSLNQDEKKLYAKSVFYALNNAEDGELVYWNNPKRFVSGKIRIVQTIHHMQSYCRVYQSIVSVNSKVQEFSNHACKETNQQWKFLK